MLPARGLPQLPTLARAAWYNETMRRHVGPTSSLRQTHTPSSAWRSKSSSSSSRAISRCRTSSCRLLHRVLLHHHVLLMHCPTMTAVLFAHRHVAIAVHGAIHHVRRLHLIARHVAVLRVCASRSQHTG